MASKEITFAALKIKKVLEQGYYIAEWPNSEGKINYYLVENGKQPYNGGVYICPKS